MEFRYPLWPLRSADLLARFSRWEDKPDVTDRLESSDPWPSNKHYRDRVYVVPVTDPAFRIRAAECGTHIPSVYLVGFYCRPDRSVRASSGSLQFITDTGLAEHLNSLSTFRVNSRKGYT